MKRLLYLAIISVLLSACTERMVATTGSIYGTVQDAQTGKPLNNCNVLLNPTGLSTTTGSDGSFHFANIEGGQHTIQASKTGYTTNTKNITVMPGSESRADLLLYETSATIGAIYGTITDADSGIPIQGCNVVLQPGGEAITTGSDGTYIFRGLAAGEYSIQVTKRNYHNNSKTGIHVQTGKSVQVDILLEVFKSNERLAELSGVTISNITSSSARVESSITDQGSASVTECGFVYGLSPNPTIDNGIKSTSRANNNQFSSNISGLEASTKYYIVPYAINALGIAYGASGSFTTLNIAEEPTPTDIVYVSQSGNDSNDGSSWMQAKRTIGNAVSCATQGQQIWVSIGTYNEVISPANGIHIYGGFTGSETSLNNRNVNSRTSVTAIKCDVYTQETVIDGFKIANHNGGGDAIHLRDYACLRNSEILNNTYSVINVSCRETSCIIENCFIQNNKVADYEGVINVSSNGVVTLVNCCLQGNESGYTIYSEGYIRAINCVIANNEYGARCDHRGEFINTTFASNDNYAIAACGNTQLYNCIIWNNDLIERYNGSSDGIITQEYCKYVKNADNSSVRFVAPVSSVGISDWNNADWSLSAGSSCIDAGANILYPTDDVPYDIAGNPRISNNVIDIGAYEY